MPRWAAAGPGRVNLIGEHTDYNDGFVLPMALQRRTVIVAGPGEAHTVTLHSNTTGESATFSLKNKLQPGEPVWANYVLGVIAGFIARKIRVPGFNAVIESDVPLGGGLSSSAALEVATATLLETMTRRKLDPVAKALLCQKAEHDFAGVPCGIMDQFISVMGREGKALLLDCRTHKPQLVGFSDPGVSILVINTNVRHKLADGEYGKRRAQCESAARTLGVKALRDVTVPGIKASAKKIDPLIFRRARHVVTENKRTQEAAKALRAGDWKRMGELMYASHASLRDDYEVSCKELDIVVEITEKIGLKGGVFGCRMTGGGFGGCAVALVKTSRAREIAAQIDEAYQKRTKIVPALFTSRPGNGATVLEIPG
jgi:galactokinase